MAKICKQCGELKPESAYRKYYGGRKGTYKTCKQCEKINSRAKYLRGKEELSSAETEELSKIEALYEAQRAAGLQPPRELVGREKSIVDVVDDMLAKYSSQSTDTSVSTSTQSQSLPPAPHKLTKWLFEPLVETPEYYIDNVYDKLEDEFRPIQRYDATTRMPIRDDTYKDVLIQILERFYTYEKEYYSKEENE